MKPILLLVALSHPLLFAATTVESEPSAITPASPALAPEAAKGEAREALDLFRSGNFHAAVEAARPLAEKGDPDALFLMGFASETGQGVDVSRDNALEYYRRAAQKGHKEATYRRPLILLNSSDAAERNLGRKALESASETDPATAGRILGEAWLRGFLGDESRFDQAVTWWGRASEAGDTTSLILLARLYSGEFDFAEKAEPAKALDYYRKAADLGEKAAYIPLGSRLLNGPEEQRDESAGRKWLRLAAEDKQSIAFLALGDFEESIRKDAKAAAAAYRKGADAGQVDCMLRLAAALYNGSGLDKDEDEGRKWLEKAAEAGQPQAAYEIAGLLSRADAPDPHAVYPYLLKAASAGLPAAQNDLGLLYLSGRLGGTDGPAAAAWFARAARAGFALAQNNLGALYERGFGVAANYNNAGDLYSRAAKQGHAAATTALARMHALGLGTDPNLPKAWALASLAVERGDQENAPALLEQIAATLTPEQLAKAQKELENLKPGSETESGSESDSDSNSGPSGENATEP